MPVGEYRLAAKRPGPGLRFSHHDRILLAESGRLAARLKISRAEYIRMAVERMNHKTASRLRAERLAEVSRRVRDESMRVNAEFAAIKLNADA